MTPSARTYAGQYRKFSEGQRRLGERGQCAMDFPGVSINRFIGFYCIFRKQGRALFNHCPLISAAANYFWRRNSRPS